MQDYGSAKYWASAAGLVAVLLLLYSRSSEFWSVVAGLVALLSIPLTIFIYLKERSKSIKRLSVSKIPVSSLINRAARVDGRPLRVFFGEDLVSNFAISRIRIKNIGGADIVPVDFGRNIAIDYGNVHKIYYAEIKEATSPSLTPAITVQDRQVIIEPLILNATDSFIIEAGIDMTEQHAELAITALGRIAGVREIEVGEGQDAESPDSVHLLGAAGLGLLGGAALAGVLAVFVFNSFVDEAQINPIAPPDRPGTSSPVLGK